MFENHANYNCEIELDNGQRYRVYANWMHNQDLDHWQGWTCHAGSRRLYIDKDLRVFSAVCKNDYLGITDDFTLLEHTECQQPRCNGCTDDLMVAKQQGSQ